jgi:hypothetical protein
MPSSLQAGRISGSALRVQKEYSLCTAVTGGPRARGMTRKMAAPLAPFMDALAVPPRLIAARLNGQIADCRSVLPSYWIAGTRNYLGGRDGAERTGRLPTTVGCRARCLRRRCRLRRARSGSCCGAGAG